MISRHQKLKKTPQLTGKVHIRRLHRCWRQLDVGDFMLVTNFGCWLQNSNIRHIYWMLKIEDNGDGNRQNQNI